jgi:hypothetical protein
MSRRHRWMSDQGRLPLATCLRPNWLKLLIVKSCELLTSGFGAGIGGSGALS